jgi:hypothetical protein
MLRHLRFPGHLFAGSQPTLDALRRGIEQAIQAGKEIDAG